MSVVKTDVIKFEILIQAQRLFHQFGLEKTTMEEIATACGKGKNTLYHYFKDKEQVFNDVIHFELLRLRQQVEDKVDEHKRMRDKVRTYFLEFNKGITHEVTLARIVTKDFHLKRTAQKYFSELMRYEKAYLVQIIEDGYDSDEYKKASREDIPEVVELLLVAFFGVIDYSMGKENDLDKEKLQQTIDLIVFMLFY